MSLDVLSDFKASAQEANVLFYYSGYFSQNVIAAMAETIRSRLAGSDISNTQRKKIFSSFVEMSQNIVHYSADSLTPSEITDGEIRRGSLCIHLSEDGYTLLSTNPIKHSDIERLRERLLPLRDMTLTDIKQAYRAALRQEQNPDTNSKGAGLGFLTIARDASAPLDFYFTPAPDDPTSILFCVKAII
ncbi:SiaB family protein kinase [Marinimicrobium alkaliphilum]|uniref:SiaB family protein kinase n=1 Tax=Marinimicrobium alkaliphilum TaxID=2202654 RepID=UPI000DB9AB39|nr:SiaB family protein kinase [Marinimicrobium alkaliphilum]